MYIQLLEYNKQLMGVAIIVAVCVNIFASCEFPGPSPAVKEEWLANSDGVWVFF